MDHANPEVDAQWGAIREQTNPIRTGVNSWVNNTLIPR